MPVGLPPRGGPMGRSRGRLSASALTTFLRCPRQWLLNYQGGMQGPTRPSQILGVVLEEAFCELLMHHPPGDIESIDGLQAWASEPLAHLAEKAMMDGKKMWEGALWKAEGADWDSLGLEVFIHRLEGGLQLFLSEVQACFDAGGGPWLEAFRKGEEPFEVPAPTWSAPPVFPLPEKVPDVELRRWSLQHGPQWQPVGAPLRWNEAWECARPWFKDPRVHQPQRLYHPDGWASGELDLVLRWDGDVRVVDIKSGNSESVFASSLEHQLRFYSWLWWATHRQERVVGMEGWYLQNAQRVAYEVPTAEELDHLTTTYGEVHHQMQTMVEGVLIFPEGPEKACEGSAAGCNWCSVSRNGNGDWNAPDSLQWVADIPQVSTRSPYQTLRSIQGRVAVKGRLTGVWGPMPNHFGEPVLGAVLVVGSQHITVEESEPGAFQQLHDFNEKEVVLLDALPGVWRDQPRLYLDARSSVFPSSDEDMIPEGTEFTRLGLLRTRANVVGHVLSIGQRSGVRVDGKPWTMLSLMLWDGEATVEVVAFGSSINQRLLELRPGSSLAMTGVEIGWRSGVLQLRIDNRKTRIEGLPKR